MHFLRRQQRKSVSKVETHLIAEYALRPHSSTIVLHHPVLTDMLQKFKILFHLQKKYYQTSQRSSSPFIWF